MYDIITKKKRISVNECVCMHSIRDRRCKAFLDFNRSTLISEIGPEIVRSQNTDARMPWKQGYRKISELLSAKRPLWFTNCVFSRRVQVFKIEAVRRRTRHAAWRKLQNQNASSSGSSVFVFDRFYDTVHWAPCIFYAHKQRIKSFALLKYS